MSSAVTRFAVRFEMARRIEDILARRCRLLFLDAALAQGLAEPVAALLQAELGHAVSTQELDDFKALGLRWRTAP